MKCHFWLLQAPLKHDFWRRRLILMQLGVFIGLVEHNVKFLPQSSGSYNI